MKQIRHEYQGNEGPEVLVANAPELPVLIDVIAERDVRRSAFFSTEMGRQYFERIGAREPVDLAQLEATCGVTDRKAFTRALSWGIEETLDCITSVEGFTPGDPLPEWLLKNRKPALMELRDKLFGDEPQ